MYADGRRGDVLPSRSAVLYRPIRRRPRRVEKSIPVPPGDRGEELFVQSMIAERPSGILLEEIGDAVRELGLGDGVDHGLPEFVGGRA